MLENSGAASGPDFFGLYETEIDELLNEARRDGSTNEASTGSASLFSNGIGALLSEFKKERLRSLLRQSVFTLTQEIDEMENPVLSLCRIRSCLKCKEKILSSDSSTCKADEVQHPQKKAKVISACPDLESEHIQLDDDMRFILENDSTKVEELMESHTSALSTTLDHMEKKLEGILNAVMTSCRDMKSVEKQQLRRLIQKLPAKNLDRIVEIIEQNNHSLNYSCDEVKVDLERLDNVTLWRLYFYVAAVEVASTT